ncbi:CCCH zinc finger protein [Coprinopsis cinerea okayama7|uniref:CCCH zinc finger protein n=1 Tax=Coprinopsis cinerea (strain Okayama-7 / 130 / ATCC MYA-4618 / FGSC 9003) TaxID=240176 RepID=A8N8X4_COPC7|nr:CCCH zinc finger protein [Coprinopsis cinerea okayama7\|eukprot:XP_001831302.2 CCCH zinc finger protein [Coprinopsis cinerea okayama7\
MTTEADLKSEIARLTATINQHKTTNTTYSGGYGGYPGRGRGGGYRGGYYSSYGGYNSYPAAGRGGTPRFANNKYVRPGLQTSTSTTTVPTTSASATASTSKTSVPSSSTFDFKSGSTSASSTSTQPSTSSTVSAAGTKDVVIGGVAFESSARSLVRKDSGKPPSAAPFPYVRKSGHLVAPSRSYKPKMRRGRNLTLDNTRKSWRENKKRKYLNKPCPRFTTTGACNRGLTCMYQHDPSKIAICWNFLQDNCPNTAETCQLSHDPTPERTPLCVHFLNKGRCTRGGCPFPHVNVGKREGICRDFAVLGYCEKGLDCDKQHIRECPDFAENGTCSTKGCKLPHVIRANRGRKAATAPTAAVISDKAMDVDAPAAKDTDPDSSVKDAPIIYAEDGKLGDEYISLTFHESEEEEESDEEEEESEESDEEEEEGESEGSDAKDSESE